VNKVLSIGDLVVDLVAAIPHLPVEAEVHQLASSIVVEPGGAGNFLIAGARLGLQMHALGAVGEDPFGQLILAGLKKEAVGVEGILTIPGSTTTTVIVLVDEQGRHVYLGRYGQGSVVDMPPVWEGMIASSQAVFSFGYTLQEERFSGACQQAIQQACKCGVPVFFDPGPEMARTTQAQKDFIVSHSQVLLMTEDEIPLLAGGQNGLNAARQLLDFGAQAVCVKRGPAGSVLFTQTGTFEHPGYPVAVRDTTAAGDTFAAAFIFAWLQGWDPGRILAFSNAMGAAKVRKIGSGSQCPTAAEVQAVLDEFHTEMHIFSVPSQ
jgi:ribokinase